MRAEVGLAGAVTAGEREVVGWAAVGKAAAEKVAVVQVVVRVAAGLGAEGWAAD